MAWTGIARHEHSREGLRYPSDMTDAEWALIMPFVSPAKRGGRPRTADMREVVNAILYIASGGCAWRLLPKCQAFNGTHPRSAMRLRKPQCFVTYEGLTDLSLIAMYGGSGEVRTATSRTC